MSRERRDISFSRDADGARYRRSGHDSDTDRRVGNVVDFAMNDKCAAGTGRFLEAIADLLEYVRSTR